MNTNTVFVRNLRQRRRHAGMSQAELARRMSELLGDRVDPTTITRIEKGERAVRLDDASAAALALGVPLAELLGATTTGCDEAWIQAMYDLAAAELLLERARGEVTRREVEVRRLHTHLQQMASLGSGGSSPGVSAPGCTG